MKRLFTTYPEILALFFYNSGVFLWLQAQGQRLLDGMPPSDQWGSQLPAPLQEWTGSTVEGLAGLVQSSTWAWLICSMLVLWLIRLVKGLIKWTLIVLLLALGLYLLWQYGHILPSF